MSHAAHVQRKLLQESWYPITFLSIKSRLFPSRHEELQGKKNMIENKKQEIEGAEQSKGESLVEGLGKLSVEGVVEIRAES